MPAPDIARDPDPLMVVVLDRTHARFFQVKGRRVVEVAGLISSGTPGGRLHSDREDAPGGGEYDYHNRLREEERRHYAAIARRLLQLKRARGARGLLVAGPGPVPRVFRRSLPAGLAARVIGTARLNPLEVTAPAVGRAAWRARQGHQRSVEADLVTTLREGCGTGWAVNGAAATTVALQRRRARVLLVAEGAVAGSAAGAVMEARRQGVPVCVVHGAGATQVAELGALLRYREV